MSLRRLWIEFARVLWDSGNGGREKCETSERMGARSGHGDLNDLKSTATCKPVRELAILHLEDGVA
jgi:hypothetical protein